MFIEMFNEKTLDLSAEFSKMTGIEKDKKKLGKGDVYFLKDNSSVVIGAEKGRIQYYDKNMEYVTSYTRVTQAIKALGQAGVLFESTKGLKCPKCGSADVSYVPKTNEKKILCKECKEKYPVNEAKTMSDTEALELIKSKPMQKVMNVKTGNTFHYTKKGELLIGVEGNTSYDQDSKDQTQDYSSTKYLEKGKYTLSEKTGGDQLLNDLKDAYYGMSDSDPKEIVLLLNNMDYEDAKRLKINTDKEAKIYSKIAELLDQSQLGRYL